MRTFFVSLCSGTSRPVEGMRQSSSSAASASPSSLSPMRPDDAPSHRSSSSEAAASEFICFARSRTSGDRNRVSSFLLSCSCLRVVRSDTCKRASEMYTNDQCEIGRQEGRRFLVFPSRANGWSSETYERVELVERVP